MAEVLNKIDTILYNIVSRHTLGAAIDGMKSMATDFRDFYPYDDMDRIEKDYGTMLGFIHTGYRDRNLEEQYHDLLRRLYTTVADMETRWRQKTLVYYVAAVKTAGNTGSSLDLIKSVLERHMADLAISALNISGNKQEENERHFVFMNKLFCHIWTSLQWNKGEMEFYTTLLTSGLITIDDAVIITAAINTGLINQWDPRKLQTLINVYTGCSDERIKQRALTGIAYGTCQDMSLFTDVSDTLEGLLQNEDVRKELLELQEQTFLCIDAEKDHRTIQKDVLPNIVKNNNLKITEFGIVEKDEDIMRDILHPEAEDKRQEEIEKGIKKIMDMQQSGSDIFYGGFSKMKSFPFFSTMSNWFCLYSQEHPALKEQKESEEFRRINDSILKAGHFCDSDKYSFAFVVSEWIKKLPKQVLEAMTAEQVAMAEMQKNDNNGSATIVRRLYLQDIYRFYKVSPMKDDMRNPFDSDKAKRKMWFFFIHPLFSKHMERERLELGRFLAKKKKWTELIALMESCNYGDDITAMQLHAWALLKDRDYQKAVRLFARTLETNPDNVISLRGLAKASIYTEDYATAATAYGKLEEINENSLAATLNYCVSLIKTGRTDESLDVLFRLLYENGEDTLVKRILAWALLTKGDHDKAWRYYTDLIECDNPKADDFLNGGYCQWIRNNIADAVELFRTYMEKCDYTITQEKLIETFNNDRNILHSNEISNTDILVMADMVCYSRFV